MHAPSLLLQNSLARAASLLFRIGDSLGDRTKVSEQCLLKMEVAEFFSEVGNSLQLELSATAEPGESAPSAQPVANSGPVWNSAPPSENTSSPDGPASTTEPPTSAAEAFSNFSTGGIPASNPLFPLVQNPSPPNTSSSKPPSTPFKSSGKFLLLTYSTGQRLLIQVSSVASIIEDSEGNGSHIFYTGNPEPDHVRENFDLIMENL